jgi:hypothetical protein
MSTLNVSNISDGTDTVATGYVVNGSAKAWVNFSPSSGIYSGQSFNVSSFNDVGAGEAEINLTNASASVYSPVVGMSGSSASRNLQTINPPLSTTSVIEARTYSAAGNLSDAGINMLALMGDLA